MWTRRFWLDAAERMAKSAAQAVAVTLTGDHVLNAWDANWRLLGGVALGAALASLVSSLASSRVGDSSSASLVRPDFHRGGVVLDGSGQEMLQAGERVTRDRGEHYEERRP
jgi:hypothetical protein